MHKPQHLRPGLLTSLVGLLAPLLLVPQLAAAQEEPPPPPPPPPADEGQGYGWEGSGEASGQTSAEANAAAPPGAGAQGRTETTAAERAGDPTLSSRALADTTFEDAADLRDDAGRFGDDDDFERWRRAEALRAHNSLRGSTGLMRVREAASGPVGSFRIGLYGGLYSGSDFLCTNAAPCFDRSSGDRLIGDDVSRMAANFTVSATPWPFLEAFFGVHNASTSNSFGRPQLLQVLGDANLGVKVFQPTEADEIFSYGGEAELLLLNGTGGVGLDGGGTSFALRALGTADLSNRRRKEDRIPIRAHANLGYLFDNSAQVVKDLETTAPPDGRGQPIERVERFGLGLSRVDSFQIGLGVEYLADIFRPFVEWTIDVPVNRQGYVCNIDSAARRGDRCLGEYGRLSAMPSRVSLGTRVHPWQGLALTAALDVATGGSSRFLEEMTPELPYVVWLGVAYTVDTQPPREIERVVVGDLEPRRYVEGRVLGNPEGEPLPDAILRYDGLDRTGMVANSAGAFRTDALAPGRYTFVVTAEGYKEGRCEVEIPSDVPDDITADSGDVMRPAEVIVPVECKLDPLPKVATITGLLVDAATGEPIPHAAVKVTDKLGRELELIADETGAFQFRNVPFGRATVTATGSGYLTTVAHFDIQSRKDIEARLSLNERPEQPNVEVTDKELKLKRQVHFLYDSAEILPDSLSILEEIAEALKAHPEIDRVEIQGHTDNTGQPDYNRQLSHRRAEAVKTSLVKLGIPENRLTAKGYGPDKPLVPNTNDANRARNRRVQLIVVKRSDTDL